MLTKVIEQAKIDHFTKWFDAPLQNGIRFFHIHLMYLLMVMLSVLH